jgi:putative addiction module component (TIGR02574 family)
LDDPEGRMTTVDWPDEVPRLSVRERLRLMDLIWDSLRETDPASVIPEWHYRELERRDAAAQADPDAGTPWSEIRDRHRKSP